MYYLDLIGKENAPNAPSHAVQFLNYWLNHPTDRLRGNSRHASNVSHRVQRKHHFQGAGICQTGGFGDRKEEWDAVDFVLGNTRFGVRASSSPDVTVFFATQGCGFHSFLDLPYPNQTAAPLRGKSTKTLLVLRVRSAAKPSTSKPSRNRTRGNREFYPLCRLKLTSWTPRALRSQRWKQRFVHIRQVSCEPDCMRCFSPSSIGLPLLRRNQRSPSESRSMSFRITIYCA